MSLRCVADPPGGMAAGLPVLVCGGSVTAMENPAGPEVGEVGKCRTSTSMEASVPAATMAMRNVRFR